MRPRVRATYRVQLTPAFGFDDAAAVVNYLADLGVSHLYTSPLFEATPGSAHGYDITDHGRVRAELGGDPALRRLWETLARHGMGQIVDLVPNHMGIRSPTNRWWNDVLAHGRTSTYANHFDIDWSPDGPGRGRIVLPFLGRPLAELVHDGEIVVERAPDGTVTARHHGDRWPISSASLHGIGVEPDDDDAVIAALTELRHDAARLVELLDQQQWWAVPWRDTSARLNWRRFFDVTDLAAVQVERPEVFDDVHEVLRGWLTDDPLAAEVVQGVRVDHVDGLVDPQAYLVRLRDLVGPDRLLLVEKILATDEHCPESWPIDGTTGYEVMARLNEVFTPPRGAVALLDAYRERTGDARSWSEVETSSRHAILRDLLAPEARRAAAALQPAVRAEAPHLELTIDRCLDLVRELASAFDVYRVYPRPGSTTLSAHDQARVDTAAARVRRLRPDLDGELLDVTVALLTRRRGAGPESDELGIRFGQLTAPLAAKAIEDTAFYRWTACLWLNEVGGDPDRLDPTTADLQDLLTTADLHHPGTLVPLSTHDTKRSADVRARLGRLAELPHEFATAVTGWHDTVQSARGPARLLNDDPALEWLLWQTLVGAWPIETDRAVAYAIKAAREAKTRTSWVDPDPDFEAGIVAFVEFVLGDTEMAASIGAFAAAIRPAGRAASLAQVALAVTVVGPPDIYQGDDLWNLSLVDPDNRRPVEWDRHRTALDRVKGWTGDEVVARWSSTQDLLGDDGDVKLAVLQRLLRLRSGPRPSLTDGAEYRPLAVEGPDADAVFAFARGDDLIVVAPRRFMTPVDADVSLPTHRWVDTLTQRYVTGGRRRVADLTSPLPVAVLVRQP